jgi:hypothetical protein
MRMGLLTPQAPLFREHNGKGYEDSFLSPPPHLITEDPGTHVGGSLPRVIAQNLPNVCTTCLPPALLASL